MGVNINVTVYAKLITHCHLSQKKGATPAQPPISNYMPPGMTQEQLDAQVIDDTSDDDGPSDLLALAMQDVCCETMSLPDFSLCANSFIFGSTKNAVGITSARWIFTLPSVVINIVDIRRAERHLTTLA